MLPKKPNPSNRFEGFGGAIEGFRTLCIQDHNLALYRVSYNRRWQHIYIICWRS